MPAVRAAPVERAYKWGPFLLSELHPGGVFKGWGATCGRHEDEGSTLRCKVSLNTGDKLSSDEAQLRLKRWLIAGLTCGGTRVDHMAIRPRDLAAGVSPAELEAAVLQVPPLGRR